MACCREALQQRLLLLPPPLMQVMLLRAHAIWLDLESVLDVDHVRLFGRTCRHCCKAAAAADGILCRFALLGI